MEKIHEKLKPKEFKKPNSVVSATICTKCGKLAVNGLCDNAVGGSCSRTEYFAKGTVPTENCDCHVKVKVCSSSNRQPSEFCPGNLIQEKVFLIKKETAATADTPNILPKNFENTICNVHSHAATPEPSEPPEEEPTDSPDTENPEPPEEEPANEPEVTQEPTEEPTAPPEDQPDDVEPPEET